MFGSLHILTALGAMLCWGFGDFFIQKSTRKIGDVETLAWIGVVGSIGMLPFVWNDLFLVLNRSNVITLCLLGVLTFGVAILNFEALRRGKLSVVEILLELELPITVLLSVLFLQEHLTTSHLILILIIFGGILLISVKPDDLKKKKHFFEHGAVLALFAAVGYGFINFLTTVGARHVSPLLSIWLPWVTFTFICLLYLALKGSFKNVYYHTRDNLKLIASVGVLDTFAWIFFALAVQKNELAITIAITESYPAISLLLGIGINKEKVFKHQLVGAAITITASFLMSIL